MNLSINNINFQGKNEVYYGLKKAAMNSRDSEFCKAVSMGPRPIDKSFEREKFNAVMKAYLDMAVYDEFFPKTILDLTCDTESKKFLDLKNYLKPEQMQYTKTNPIGEFKRWLKIFVEKHNVKIDKSLIEEFVNKLES